MAITVRPSNNFNHVYWIDLHQNGLLVECAVLKQDKVGNTYYIALKDLDTIDKQRIANILNNRNAPNFELFDLMSQVTLGNGVNALTYFQQLVQQLTPNGQIIKPGQGVMGTGIVQTAAKPTVAVTAPAE